MRVIYRIVYALILAIGLYLTIDLTNSSIVTDYINEKGSEALEQNDYSFFISSRYYHVIPIYEGSLTFDAYQFDVLIYNVANLRTLNNKLDVVEGFHMILHQKQGEDLPMPFSVIIHTIDEEIKVENIGLKIADLPIYTIVSATRMSTFVNKNLFKNEEEIYQEVVQIEFLRYKDSLAVIDITIDESAYQLKPLLDDYIQTHQNAPTEAFNQVGYTPRISVDARPKVYRNSAIYVVLAGTLTVVLFTVRKKYMGRKQATLGLTKDIERIQFEREEKR